ncbi:hypothetical protein [Pseudomonas sp. FP818]|uniref:hypothetical protein n=1 Tax=Pseudomonas sp. FP818 TaxID=2954099 RepID=UPI00273479CD|nr:hypothetical protein [Pseudomonas sp. FP818]WLI32899.1 hypothetical protein PSH80_16735 [Pseudomonas sp. FP818]
MSAEQQLAILPAKEVALAVFSATNGLDPYLQSVREEIDKFNASAPDVKTKKGQDAYRSIAYSLAGSKTKLDSLGKELVAELKDIPKKIDAERKRVRELLSAWQEEVRKPLTDWEAAEQARKDKHVDGIQAIKDMTVFEATPTAAHVAQFIADLEAVEINDTWEEFLPEAAQVKDETLAKLRALLAERAQYEAEQAELVRLRAEAEAQAQRDRDTEIARVAAEQAQRQAEERAQAERDAAERQRLQLELQAEQARTAAAQAEASRVAAEQRAEQERIAAIKRQEEAVEQARIAEQARADAAADDILRQAAAREADKAHQAKINRAALEAFIAGGMPEACAKQAVTLIAQRKIPSVSIAY